MLFRKLIQHISDRSILYLSVYILILFILGLWPFNFKEKNNAVISPAGGLEIARHGTAYSAPPAGKLQDLKQFAILIDLTTSSDGLDSLGKIFGYLISQEAENFFLAQWKDGMELRVRTERNAGGMIFGADGVLKKDERAACLIIYDGLKMHIYKNGKLVRRDNRGSLSFGNWDKTYPLVVGTDAQGRSQWKGRLYEIAVFDRAMTSDEVMRLSSQSSLSGLSGRKDKKSKNEIATQPSAARNDPKAGVGGILRQAQDDRPLIHYVFKPENTKAVTSDQWPVTSEGERQHKRPLIHYVFNQENTYQTTFGGKKALGVRDLGKGEPADLVIPAYFAPYERVYLGWDPDWMKRSSDWLDVAVNILGFIPFGLLLLMDFANRRRGFGLQASGVGTKEENPPLSPFMKGGGLEGGPFAKGGGLVVAVVLAVIAGFVVSFAIEYLQAYLPSRDSSMRDLITNVLGTFIGALAAAWLLRNRIATASQQ